MSNWHILAQKRPIAIGLLILAFVAVGITFWLSSTDEQKRSSLQQVPAMRDLSYVPNQSCAGCHTQQVEQWLGSHHEQAMQVATDETVLGDFDAPAAGASFTDQFGVTSRFFKREGKFFVNTEGADGKYADFEVKYTFGVTPLQQYLLALPRGRFQALTVAWDTQEERWFSLFPDEHITPDNPLHWTKLPFTWNSTCAECHSTNLQLNYEVESDRYQTSWSEINVSCQACHGPGEEHVKWAQEALSRGTREENEQYENKGLVVDYKRLDSRQKVETCAPCHSRRYAVSADDQPARPFLDDFMPELLREGFYHADGQILEEVYVYGSFIQSKMYHEGVTCMDCHNPHTLETRREGNELCTGCHQLTPPTERFETLRSKTYDTKQHHFHAEGSAGAQCVECHNPTQTYMQIDPRRDHSFRIPRPDLSLNLGVPNACTQCHTDQSDEWAARVMNEWYGQAWQERFAFAEIIAAERAGEDKGNSPAGMPLIELADDATQPEIVRATALDLLSGSPPLAPPNIGGGRQAQLDALSDDSALVRATALHELGGLLSEPEADRLLPLLSDPIRAVRIEAARALASVPPEQLRATEEQRRAFEVALEEYKAAQLAQADHPEGHFNLAQLYAVMADADPSSLGTSLAEASYQRAIERDAHFLPAYNNLATLYYQTGRQKEAEKTFRQALEVITDDGQLYYSLGLLLVEIKALDEAADSFAEAAALMPEHQRLHYNYGLLLQQLGQTKEAESVLLRAYELNQENADVLYALATFYMQQKLWEQAHPYALKLTQLYPEVPLYLRVLESIEKEGVP